MPFLPIALLHVQGRRAVLATAILGDEVRGVSALARSVNLGAGRAFIG